MKIFQLNENFSIPFINRVDNIIEFNYLNDDDIKKIIDLKINDLKGKYKNRIKIKIDKDIYNEILRLSNYKTYGARKIDKIIKDKVEIQIIDSIIDDAEEVYIKNLMQVI